MGVGNLELAKTKQNKHKMASFSPVSFLIEQSLISNIIPSLFCQVYHQTWKGVDHMQLLKHQPAIDYIVKVAQSGGTIKPQSAL